MLCPFCLAEGTFQQERSKGAHAAAFLCPTCREQIPALYVKDYAKYPPMVVSAIGFRQHGKTVYFASLFYALKKLALARHWPKFFSMGLNEDSLNTVQENVNLLEGGQLPYSTPKNFPRPTLLRIEGVPMQPNATLVCYDTGGECFERPSQMVQYAGFVGRAKTAMLLVSTPDLTDPAREMQRLLNTYVVGMAELGGTTRNQNLIVIFTKADEMTARLSNWRDLAIYLTKGALSGLREPKQYMTDLYAISNRLREFTRQELKADEFVNMAHQNFAGVTYTMVSALGAKPYGDQLAVQVAPRRVLDPLLWMMEHSQAGWQRTLRRVFSG